MATKAYTGLLLTVVDEGVLINAGNQWSVHGMQEFLMEADDVLKNSTQDNNYIQWYNYWED